MSQRTPDAVRTALIEAAAALLSSEGPAALTTRRLATLAGTSTMAVYTHFGGMDGLRSAVRIEGFTRLGQWLAAVPRTDDAVADIWALGLAYLSNAHANPHLYRVMLLEEPVEPAELDVFLATFERLVDAAARAVAAGQVAADDGHALALRLWSFVHGIASLQLAGAWTFEEGLAHAAELGRWIFRGLGVSEQGVARALEHAAGVLQERLAGVDLAALPLST